MAAITKTHQDASKAPNIRVFNPQRDMKVVADLIERCFSDTLDQDGKRYIQQMRNFAREPGLLSWLPLLPEWVGAPFIGYVWEQDGAVVGNVSLVPYRVASKRNYMIANVAVDPEYRRQGIAKKLTLHAIRHAKRRKADRIWLNVRQGNPAALHLYTGIGFEQRGRRTTWRIGNQHTSYQIPAGVTIRLVQPSDWSLQKQWLDKNYPVDMVWHQPVKYELLKPGLWSALRRTLSSTSISQWAAARDRQLLAAVTLQWNLTSTYRNLFLGAPDDPDPVVVTAILSYACDQVRANHAITLEFPSAKRPHAGSTDEAIQSAGFSAQQTLIWMELVER